MNRDTLRIDALAGVTVALVAVPQSLAYAQLAGLPAFYGLYAALIPTIIGALFGSSSQLSTGPVALTSLLTAASVAQLAVPGAPEYVTYAIAVGLLAGMFQLTFGVMRLGALMNLLSNPVLMGFVNAAAILITLSQIPTFLGANQPATGHVVSDAYFLLTHPDRIHIHSAAYGLSAVLLLAGFRRYKPKLPGVLICVATFTVLSYFTGYAESGGRIVGDIPQGLPGISLPALEWNMVVTLLPASFVIAVVSFMEAMSSAKVAAIKTGTRWDEDQELIGQGLAKIAAALCHTMPVSGSFSRSALNLASNAQTGISSIVCALCVLLTILFFTPLLKYLPQPVLAAVIIMVVSNLVNLRSLRNAWRASNDDAIAALVTFAATMAFAPKIQDGILTGIILSLGLFIYRRMRPTVTVIAAGSNDMAREHVPAILADAVGIVRFDASLIFVNAAFFEDAVLGLEQECPGLRFILVSAGAINRIDASGVEILSGLVEELREKDIVVVFSAIKAQVAAVLDRTGLADRIGRDNFFYTESGALEALAARMAPAPVTVPMQQPLSSADAPADA